MMVKQITFIWIVFFIAYLSPLSGYAQFEKGHKIIGGNFGFSYSHNTIHENYSRSGNFSVSPTIGYFISEKSMIGISPTISLSSYHSNLDSEPDNRWGLGTSVFYRRFIKASDQFHFFIEPSLGYFGRNNSDYINEWFHVALSPGLVYLASDRFWVEAKFGGLSYQNERIGPRNNVSSYNFFHAGLNSFTSLGFYFILK